MALKALYERVHRRAQEKAGITTPQPFQWKDRSWYESPAWAQGGGWDVHDLYDWFPGVESGEQMAAIQNLRNVVGQVPQPVDLTQFRSYMDRLNTLSGQAPGEGWQGTPFYKDLIEGQYGVKQRVREAGWAEGRAATAQGNYTHYGQGGLRAPSYGAALRSGTEQQAAAQQMYGAAASQAYQARVQAQEQEFDRVLKTVGFAVDLQDSQWEQKFRAWAVQADLAQTEIEMIVERHRMILDLGGKALSVYALSRRGGGGVGGGSGPLGQPGGGILPSSVG